LYRVLATRYLHPWVVWLTTGRKLTDTSTGFRAIRTDVFRNPRVNLRQAWLKDYDCEMYILYKAITLGYRVAEAPASKIYPPRALGYTKMPPITGWWKMLRPFFVLRLGLRR
jgi:dolichol-phosphate mannosyltransferase